MGKTPDPEAGDVLSALAGLASPDAAAREAAIASLGSTLSVDQLRDRQAIANFIGRRRQRRTS